MRKGRPSDFPQAAKIERHRLRPKLIVRRRKRSPPDERTGVVDQDVEPAEKRHRLGHDAFRLFRRSEIASTRGTAPTEHARFVHQRFPGRGCALAIETKKFFMDEHTGAVDGAALAGVTNALAGTVDGVLGVLAREGR